MFYVKIHEIIFSLTIQVLCHLVLNILEICSNVFKNARLKKVRHELNLTCSKFKEHFLG